jgi:protein SCO1/2
MKRTSAAAVAVAVLALSLAASGCGSSSTTASVASATAPGHGRFAASAVLAPPAPAPNFALRDSRGHRVRLSQFRGRAVFLTFIYSHCPDVCPLIVAKLHQALLQLGRRASHAAVIGVSVDPGGDTPAYVNRFIAEHGMTGRMEYLIGSKRALARIWKEYGVAVLPGDAAVVGHSSVLYGITASGRRLTVYSANDFTPQAIAHDAPLLSRS